MGDLPLGISQAMTFLFDFGDRWEFDAIFERIDPDMPVESAPHKLTKDDPTGERS